MRFTIVDKIPIKIETMRIFERNKERTGAIYLSINYDKCPLYLSFSEFVVSRSEISG